MTEGTQCVSLPTSEETSKTCGQICECWLSYCSISGLP